MKSSRIVLGLLLLTSAFLAACGGSSSSSDCITAGCEEGSFCNPTTNTCESGCTADSCAVFGAICDEDAGLCVTDCASTGCDRSRNLVCDPQSHLCIQGCRFEGCNDGFHCDLSTELCVENCTPAGCPEGTVCSTRTWLCEESMQFSDAGLDSCIRDVLKKDTIFPTDLTGLVSLRCPDREIVDLTGIEALTALEDLSLYENQISDLTPLASLSKLRSVQLGANQIQDLAPLADIPYLRRLGIYGNQVSDLSPLASVASLASINADNNQITDASPLLELDYLTWLTIEHNPLGDFGPLDIIAANGCEVYAGLSAGRTTRGARLSKLAGPALSRPAGLDSSKPSLDVETDEQGRVGFYFQQGQERFRAIEEYAGQILLIDETFVYRHGPLQLVIGENAEYGQNLCTGDWAQVCSLSFGAKRTPSEMHPDGLKAEPVYTVNLSLAPGYQLSTRVYEERVFDLDPFVLATPNQFDAGSCIFMANTGAMEILMNQHTPLESITYKGQTDLSERFLMNGLDYLPSDQYDYFITDLQYIYNHLGGSLLDSDYPFTANYVKETSSGSMVPCDPDDPDGYLSLYYNWFDFLPDEWRKMLVPTPAAERTTIFLDPNLDDSSIWNVALMNDDVVERIKYELRSRNAPVIIVYNHFLYWHADIIVGYDESESVGECPMVKQTLDYFEEKGYTSYVTKIRTHMAHEGGCSNHGVFYVRDSIYDGGEEEPWYDYSNEDVQVQEERYSKRIITRSYDWVKYLANHAYTVHRH